MYGELVDQINKRSGHIYGVLPDWEIRRMSQECDPPLIAPYCEGVTREGYISSGETSSGYDLRLANTFWVYKSTRGDVRIDPKRFREEGYIEQIMDKIVAEKEFVIPPHGFVLAVSKETFNVPPDVRGTAEGKSTYVRCGIIVPVTPLEPDWSGKLTLEIYNASPLPVVLYVDEGILQIKFERLFAPPLKAYTARGGRYQNQTDVTPPRSTLGGVA